MTGEHLVDADDEVVVVNTKPPAGWQVIDGATGRRAIAEADAAKIIPRLVRARDAVARTAMTGLAAVDRQQQCRHNAACQDLSRQVQGFDGPVQPQTRRAMMDFTPTREFLEDLGNRLERLGDGEENVPGLADIVTLRMALKTAIKISRPVTTDKPTLDEMIDEAAKQPPGPDAWAPIFKAYPQLTPRGLAKAVRDFGNPIFERHERCQELFDAVIDAFDLDPRQLNEPA